MSILHVKQKLLFAMSSWKIPAYGEDDLENYAKINRDYTMLQGKGNFENEEAVAQCSSGDMNVEYLSYICEAKVRLRNLNMKFESGKKYLILGDAESGKEELLDILTRKISSYTGNVYLGQYNLKKLKRNQLGKILSVVSKDIPLIPGDIYGNVVLGDTFDEKNVRDSMGKVGLTEKNDHQEELQLERIDEYTDNEKKKISIARALVNNSSILILDETAGSEKNTSDYEIEELILNMREMTVLSVSHRITKSLMDKYDKVFVIDKGIVVEEGTFSELLLNNDYFYNLYVSNEA